MALQYPNALLCKRSGLTGGFILMVAKPSVIESVVVGAFVFLLSPASVFNLSKSHAFISF